MNNKELLILDQIYTRPNMSQRELSTSTGISLGQTNLIIKRMCDNGLLKQDSVSGRKIRYALTQRGLAEKARLSNEGILSIIRNYRKIRGAVVTLLDRLYSDGFREFVLEGDRGEMHEVISEVFEKNFRNRASLVWGPAGESGEKQIVLNLDRRFLSGGNAVNILDEIKI